MGKGISLRLTQEEGGGDGWGSLGSQALRGEEQGSGMSFHSSGRQTAN